MQVKQFRATPRGWVSGNPSLLGCNRGQRWWCFHLPVLLNGYGHYGSHGVPMDSQIWSCLANFEPSPNTKTPGSPQTGPAAAKTVLQHVPLRRRFLQWLLAVDSKVVLLCCCCAGAAWFTAHIYPSITCSCTAMRRVWAQTWPTDRLVQTWHLYTFLVGNTKVCLKLGGISPQFDAW